MTDTTNNKGKTFFKKDEIIELGKLLSGTEGAGLHGPVSIATQKRARDFMETAGKAADSETSVHQGAFLSPSDEITDATQNEEYAIEPPTAYNRLFVVKNLPLAWRVTFGVAKDCWKSGDTFPFDFVVPKDYEIEPVKWSSEACKVLRDIGYFRSGSQLMGIGEMDGEGVLILIEEGFDWQTTKVDEPRDPTLPIIDTIAIPMYYVYRGGTITEWTREGLPMYWYINLNSTDGFSRQNVKAHKFHHSRIIHYNPDPLDTSTKGLCTLDRCWQAICIGFNIDLGTGEAFFRWGIGHPVFETDFDSIEDLKAFMTNLGSPNRRTWHALLRGMKLNFVGASGTTLDFSAGKEIAVYDEVSIATGIPRPILKGEVAGVQTGSEVNERTYWAVLRTKQTSFNQVTWKLLAILNETEQVHIPDIEYNPEEGILTLPEKTLIKWAVHYVETEEQKIDLLIKKLGVLNPLKDIMTINELRVFAEDILNLEENSLPDLPEPIGNQILSIYSDPFDLEQGLAEQQLANAQNLSTPEGEENVSETGEFEGNTPTEKLESFTGGKIEGPIAQLATAITNPPEPSEPEKKPEPKKEPEKKKDEIEETPRIVVGCPDHANFHKSCPACVAMLDHKEKMARDLLVYDFSLNAIQRFLGMDRNKINAIRQSLPRH